MQLQLDDRLSVIKTTSTRQGIRGGYLGCSNTIFVFHDHFLAWNVHRFMNNKHVIVQQNEDRINHYIIKCKPLPCDKMDLNSEIVSEPKNSLMSSLSVFNMELALVNILKPVSDDKLEFFCRLRASPYNPRLETKKFNLNKIFRSGAFVEDISIWQEKVKDIENNITDIDDLISSIDKVSISEM